MRVFYTTSPVQSREFITAILRGRYGCKPQILVSENGKPFLKNPPPYFNLSHSGNITAAVVADAEVGIDIQLREIRNPQAIETRLTADEQKEDFFHLWTAKEAYIKYRGGTIARMLKTLEYRGGVLFERGAPVSAHFRKFELETCAACVCSKHSEPLEIIRIDDNII